MRLIALSFAAVLSTLVLSASSPVAHAASTKKSTVTAETSKKVTIQSGDSLSSIATNEQTTAQRLFDANIKVENPDLIYPGDELRVPSANEQLATRPMPMPAPAAAPVQLAPAVEAAPVQAQPRAAVQAPSIAGGSVWDQLAICESGGNWAINSGNGFYGGLQFTISSWQAVGGSGLPSDASREEQIMRGQMLQAIQGWGAWPACTSKLGLR